MVYINIVLYLISSFLILYNINTVVSLITNSNIKFKASLYSFLYIACSLAYIYCSINYKYPFIDLILFLLNCTLLFLYIYKKYLFCNRIKIIYIILLYLILDSTLNSIFKLIFSIFDENYVDYFVMLITSIVNYIIILVLNNVIKLKKGNFYFQTNSIPKYVYILILFAIFCGDVLIENQIIVTNDLILQSSFSKLLTVVNIVLLIFIIITLVFICTLKSQLENTALLLEKLNYLQAEHYQDRIRINDELRKFRHDSKNFLVCLQALMQEKQYDDAMQYIQEMTHKEFIEIDRFFTGNQIADAILSDKSASAEKINAKIQFDGSIYDKLPLSDVCVMLANALDNAIEACEKITDSDKKIITVKCAFSQNIQIIQISNPVEEDVQIHNNSVETTKDDKSSHGIGLHNIMRTVNKYNGEFSISCENKQFVLDIGFQVCNAENKQPVLD